MTCSTCHDVGFVHPRKNNSVDYSQVIPCSCRQSHQIRPIQVSLGVLPAFTKDGQHKAALMCGCVFRKQLSLRNKFKAISGWTLDGEFLIRDNLVAWNDLDRYSITRIEIAIVSDEHPEQTPKLILASLNDFKEKGVDVNVGTGKHRALADPFWRPIDWYRLGR